MAVSCTCEDRVLTVWLRGEVDHHAAKQIMEMLDSRIDCELPRCLKVDLSAVTFMDSSGIAVLLRAYRRMSALEGSIEVVNIPQQSARVLKAGGLQRLINFE